MAHCSALMYGQADLHEGCPPMWAITDSFSLSKESRVHLHMAGVLSIWVHILNCGRQAACRVVFGTGGQDGLLLMKCSVSKQSQSHSSASLAAGSCVGQEAPPICGGVSNCMTIAC